MNNDVACSPAVAAAVDPPPPRFSLRQQYDFSTPLPYACNEEVVSY